MQIAPRTDGPSFPERGKSLFTAASYKVSKDTQEKSWNLTPLHRLLLCPPQACTARPKGSDLFYIRDRDWAMFSHTDEVKQLS